jgi:hypothetical protein
MKSLKINFLPTIRQNRILLFITFLGILCSKKIPVDYYTQIYLTKRPSIYCFKSDGLPKIEVDSFVVRRGYVLIVVTDTKVTPMGKLYIIHKNKQEIFIDDIVSDTLKNGLEYGNATGGKENKLSNKQKNIIGFWNAICGELPKDISIDKKEELCRFAFKNYFGTIVKDPGTISKDTDGFYLFTTKYRDTILFNQDINILNVNKNNIILN